MTAANNNSCTHLLHPRDPSYSFLSSFCSFTISSSKTTSSTFKKCEKKKCLDLCSLYVGSLFPLVLISSLRTTF